MTCCSPSIDQTLETQICPFPKCLITRIMQSRVWIHPLMTSSGIRGIHYIQFKRHWNPALQTLLNNEHPDFLDACMRATANAHCNGGKPMQRQYLTPQQDLLIYLEYTSWKFSHRSYCHLSLLLGGDCKI